MIARLVGRGGLASFVVCAAAGLSLFVMGCESGTSTTEQKNGWEFAAMKNGNTYTMEGRYADTATGEIVGRDTTVYTVVSTSAGFLGATDAVKLVAVNGTSHDTLYLRYTSDHDIQEPRMTFYNYRWETYPSMSRAQKQIEFDTTVSTPGYLQMDSSTSVTSYDRIEAIPYQDSYLQTIVTSRSFSRRGRVLDSLTDSTHTYSHMTHEAQWFTPALGWMVQSKELDYNGTNYISPVWRKEVPVLVSHVLIDYKLVK